MTLHATRRDKFKKFSPRVIIITTLLISFAGILFILNSVTRSNRHHQIYAHYNSVQKLHGQVLRIDEILTMSCWVASTTGDLYWADRYYEYVPKLEKSLQELIRLSPKNTHQHIQATSTANNILVERESIALKAVKNGNLTKARGMISHPEYAEYKSKYSEGMRQLQEKIDAYFNSKISQEVAAIQHREYLVFLVSIGLAIFWGLIYRITNRWQNSFERFQEISQLMETSLRERIGENAALAHRRGIQLENLRQALLQTERQERKRLARIVHDELQQILVALRLKSAIFRDHAQEDQNKYEELVQMADEAILSARDITFRLTLPEDNERSFIDMIQSLVIEFNRRYNLFISLDVSRFEEPQRSGVSELVYQAIRELLFNVVKHAQVKSAILLMKKESGFDSYCVKDHGVGFDVGSLKTNEKYMRSGLGLLDMRNHLALIGGEVKIISQVKEGTEVWLNIPTTMPSISQRPASDINISTLSENQSFLKVFVVDDNEALRHMVVQLLNADPALHVIAEASSGPEAVELADSIDFDILLIDYSLPGYCGAEALTYIKEKKSNFTAIGFTSFDQSETINHFMKAGTKKVVVKGEDAALLLKACKSTISA